MSKLAISVKSLSKHYKIGAAKRHHDTLRDQIMHGVTFLFRRNTHAQSKREDFWALKDISFEVEQGEVVGIIGRNGAGKSTLLKILSRITDPTTGSAAIYGRIGSLLEVGTGFHPELTGRENVYFNGAVLGMKKAEIDRRFDEIIAFSEIDKFLDTQVKHYSSGMYVRLAFAVAAHLEPEILIVDEVLAVGDAAFQNKCLNRMRQIAQNGAAVLLVSHNMHVIQLLSSHCLYLRNGQLVKIGQATDVIPLYLREAHTDDLKVRSSEAAQSEYRINSIRITGSNSSNDIRSGEDLCVTMEFSTPRKQEALYFQITLWSESSQMATQADTRVSPTVCDPTHHSRVTFRFPKLCLVAGKYTVRGYILSQVDWPLASFGWNDDRQAQFYIEPNHIEYVTGMKCFPQQSDHGIFRAPFKWSFS